MNINLKKLKADNFKKISNFLTEKERIEILNFIQNLEIKKEEIQNLHIGEVAAQLNGTTFMFDLSKTDISKYLSTFQSSNQVIDNDILPEILVDLITKISDKIGIKLENAFLQIIKMKKGGKIKKHYDTSYPGFINYKCNISVLSDDYTLFTDEKNINVSQNDLYCFEASLYPHWTEEFSTDRILLSYGFGLEYQKLNRIESDPRIRMSNRIYRYFQS